MLIYTTCKDEFEAKKISEILLKEKLIACANIIQSKSLYFWQGELKNENESILLIKTIKDKSNLVVTKIKQLHSYRLPAIIQIEGTATIEFEKWLSGVMNEKHF